jgi:hypothetical protein
MPRRIKDRKLLVLLGMGGISIILFAVGFWIVGIIIFILTIFLYVALIVRNAIGIVKPPRNP